MVRWVLGGFQATIQHCCKQQWSKVPKRGQQCITYTLLENIYVKYEKLFLILICWKNGVVEFICILYNIWPSYFHQTRFISPRLFIECIFIFYSEFSKLVWWMIVWYPSLENGRYESASHWHGVLTYLDLPYIFSNDFI